jgi:hypothetical protein
MVNMQILDMRSAKARGTLTISVLLDRFSVGMGNLAGVASNGFEIRGYELRCRFSIDGVSVGAQASHAAGSPMSQRECAGFNWPPLSIPAEEPVSICPEAVNRAALLSEWPRFPLAMHPCPPACSLSIAVGVGHPAVPAWYGSCCPFALGSCRSPLWSLVVGVTHPDRHAAAAKSGP